MPNEGGSARPVYITNNDPDSGLIGGNAQPVYVVNLISVQGPQGVQGDVGPAGSSAPTGCISMFAGSAAPTGYLLCDGSSYATAAYAALFAAIGYVYGGSGANFNVPDLRQRFPLGKSDSGTGSILGATGGTIDHTHAVDGHTHAITHTHQVGPINATTGTPSATSDQLVGVINVASATHTHDFTINAFTSGVASSENSGSASPNTDAKNPPFIALNFIIKT